MTSWAVISFVGEVRSPRFYVGHCHMTGVSRVGRKTDLVRLLGFDISYSFREMSFQSHGKDALDL